MRVFRTIRRLILSGFTTVAIICGGGKLDPSNAPPSSGGCDTNAPALSAPRPRLTAPRPQPLGSQPSTSVLVTPAVSSRAARWNVRGAANDWAPVDFGTWVFPHGTNCNRTTNVVENGVMHRYAINPCGTAVGRDAYFQIELKPDDYPDTNIVWTATGEGTVAFVGSNTGRTVRVRGVSPGQVTLTVHVGDCPSSPPSFPFEVVNETRVKVSAWVITDQHNCGTRTNFEIGEMLDEVNDIYAQVGMSFYLDSVTFTNLPDAFDIHEFSQSTNGTGLVMTNGWTLTRLFDIGRDTGGLECYFVNSIVDNKEAVAANGSLGMVLTARADANCWAHEIGHVCGMSDIYTDFRGGFISIFEGFAWRHAMDDWNGGSDGDHSESARYYTSNMTLVKIIDRMLMNGMGEADSASTAGCGQIDISTGLVDGIDDRGDRGCISTGIFRGILTTRMPRHQ